MGRIRGLVGVSGSSGLAGNPPPQPIPTPPIIDTFTINDSTLTEGDTATFSWTLSGGTPTSQIVNPGDGSGNYTVSPGTTQRTHDYDIEGTYTATLTVSNSGGSDNETIQNIQVDAAAPPSDVSFKAWPSFSSRTETRKNMSGSTAVNAPVKFLMRFHKGTLPTTKTLQLRDNGGSIVPTTAWQWGERVTYPDGSLMSCIVRCYGPASWANGDDLTWTIEAVDGSWPAETDAKTVADVTGGSDININLSSVRRLGPNTTWPQVDTTQPNHTYTTLTGSMNYALGLTSRVQKRTGGSICTQWYTWAKFRNGSNNDAFLWWKGWIEVWYAPGTSTIRTLTFQPIINNGWGEAANAGRALVYKCTVTNGGATIIDYTQTLALTAANMRNASARLIFDKDIATDSHPFHPGTWAYVASGNPPVGITVGKVYRVRAQVETAGGEDAWDTIPGYRTKTDGYFGLAPLAQPGDYVMTWPGDSNLGDSWTLESWCFSHSQNPQMLFDRNARPLVAVGAYPHIAPNWSRAQKIERMELGHIPSVALDNSAPGYRRGNRPWHPGTRSLHREGLDDSGGLYWLGYHIGEIGTWTWDVLQDMTVTQSHITLLRAAAEVIGTTYYGGYYDSSTNPDTSAEYAELIDPTNGSNGAGAQHAGCGAPKPYYGRPGIGRSVAPYPGYTENGTVREDAIPLACANGVDGTHMSQALGHAFSLYPEPIYREGVAIQTMGVPIEAGLLYHTDHTSQADADIALVGVNKKFLGIRYWRCITFGVGLIMEGFSKRAQIGFTRALSFALYNPDSTPIGRWAKTLAANQLDFGKAFWNSDRMESGGKIVGCMFSLEGPNPSNPNYRSSGSNQHWQMTRVAAAALYLMKNSGIEFEECLQWATGTSRMMLNDAIGGQNIPNHKIVSYGYGMVWYDQANPAQVPLSDATSVITKYPNAAMSTPDARGVRMMGYGPLRFETDGVTVTLLNQGAFSTYHPTLGLENGTEIIFNMANYAPASLMSPLQYRTRYWLYDRAGSGPVFTYKLSSTAGPGYTPVTWTTGTPYLLGGSDNNVASNILGVQPNLVGPFPNGRFNANIYASDYLANNVTPAVTAAVMFGSEAGCDTASANWDALIADLLADQTFKLAEARPSVSPNNFYGAFNVIKKNVI